MKEDFKNNIIVLINERIEYLFDREHTIGHAFFTKLADDPSLETLASIFEKNVIPLLQEYFYEDYEKIQLVLGDNTKEDEFKFILDRSVKVKDIFNGNPDIDLPEKGYIVQHEAFLKLESYKQMKFESPTAIETLIRSVLLTVSDHDEYDNAAYALRVIDRALGPIIHDIQDAIDMIDKSL